MLPQNNAEREGPASRRLLVAGHERAEDIYEHNVERGTDARLDVRGT